MGNMFFFCQIPSPPTQKTKDLPIFNGKKQRVSQIEKNAPIPIIDILVHTCAQ